VTRELDDRLALDELARWWHAASQKARYEKLQTAIRENDPPLKTLQLAIILAEVEAGEVEEG